MICSDGFEVYFVKVGMLMMGGLLIVGVLVMVILFWVCLDNFFVLMVLFVMFSYVLIGFVDDYVKVSK